MKLHSIGQDLQDYQDFFGLVKKYLVHPVDPVRKGNSGATKFSLRSDWPLFRPAAVLDSGSLAGMTSRYATIKNLVHLKTREHPARADRTNGCEKYNP